MLPLFSVGNVYIHPTANIDPTAMVYCALHHKCIQRKRSINTPLWTIWSCYWGKIKMQVYLFLFLIQLGPNVSIGTGVTIGAGVRVRESIIIHGATLQVSPSETVSWRKQDQPGPVEHTILVSCHLLQSKWGVTWIDNAILNRLPYIKWTPKLKEGLRLCLNESSISNSLSV